MSNKHSLSVPVISVQRSAITYQSSSVSNKITQPTLQKRISIVQLV
ncbi:MAG: hypothetical protein VSS75_030625 [Candidatus Parabeggiatoa sp.]